MSETPEEPQVALHTDLVTPLMVEAVELMRGLLPATVGGLPGFVGVVAGREVAMDLHTGPEGACGKAWVRFDTDYPTQTFPQPSNDPTCNGRAVRLVLGVYRCVPAFTYNLDGETIASPSEEEWATAVAVQNSDAAMLRQVALCAWTSPPRKRVLGQWTPVGPSGGAGGGSLTVTVRV